MTLCIMGAGLEARTHIDAMLAVRKITKVKNYPFEEAFRIMLFLPYLENSFLPYTENTVQVFLFIY